MSLLGLMLYVFLVLQSPGGGPANPDHQTMTDMAAADYDPGDRVPNYDAPYTPNKPPTPNNPIR